MKNLRENVHKGMKVYDNAQNEIGTVEDIHFGEENPKDRVPEAADVSPAVQNDDQNSLVNDVAKVFAPDTLPEPLKDRLLLEGYIRMDPHGLFKSDRYILGSQIQAVNGNQVKLNVSKKELAERV